MPLQLNVQVDIVIYSLLAGVLTGILFDAYRLIRGYKIPKVIVVVEDLLFWALCALVVFTFLLYTNYAFLGPYVYQVHKSPYIKNRENHRKKIL